MYWYGNTLEVVIAHVGRDGLVTVLTLSCLVCDRKGFMCF